MPQIYPIKFQLSHGHEEEMRLRESRCAREDLRTSGWDVEVPDQKDSLAGDRLVILGEVNVLLHDSCP